MNLQQIPSKGEAKEIRRLFGAGKGNVLLSSDFSQFITGIISVMIYKGSFEIGEA